MDIKLHEGDYTSVMGDKTVYYKKRAEFIPCIVTNYYFKSRKYALVPIADIMSFSAEEHEKRRVYYTKNVYVSSTLAEQD